MGSQTFVDLKPKETIITTQPDHLHSRGDRSSTGSFCIKPVTFVL